MKTPCINVCQIDQTSRLCLGCFRKLEEIGGWSAMTDATRQAIMDDLERRKRLVQADRGAEIT
ncbi:DUF1289 domain-containing protein [Roseibium sp.]|uniref:DUF1289 domain-containing protein n=1 Tax=Roseibium sp. TaxID=1936156 RepID=UPI003A977A8D